MVIPSSSVLFNTHNAASQKFSIPSTIIFYMKKHPSSWKSYTKLIKTCKYFYSKNDPVPINGICKHRQDKPSIVKPFGQSYSYKAFKKIKKYWLCGGLFIGDVDNGVSTKIFKKIYRSDITHLRLDTHRLSFGEFKILASSKKLQYFRVLTSIRYESGDLVTFSTIFEYLPNIRHLQYEDSTAASSLASVIKIIKQLNDTIRSHTRWLQLDNTNTWKYAEYLKEHPEVQYIFIFSNPNLDENAQEFLDLNIVEPEYSWSRPLANSNPASHFLEKKSSKKQS